jgi:hypothetical protein
MKEQTFDSLLSSGAVLQDMAVCRSWNGRFKKDTQEFGREHIGIIKILAIHVVTWVQAFAKRQRNMDNFQL